MNINPNFSRKSGLYRYSFNGKEKDIEGMGGGSQTYDYGFRIYNSALGKFLSVDPLLRSYSMLSSYQYASNTPIAAIDLDGLEARIITYEYCVGDKLVSTFLELTIDVIVINNSSESQRAVAGLYDQLKPMVKQTFSGDELNSALLNITYIGPADAEKLFAQARADGKKAIYIEIVDDYNSKDKAKLKEQGVDPARTPGFTTGNSSPKLALIKLKKTPERTTFERLRTALHEIGHALGLTHPQNLDDRKSQPKKFGDPNVEGAETCSPSQDLNMDNLMNQSSVQKNDGTPVDGTNITSKQRTWIVKKLRKMKQLETY